MPIESHLDVIYRDGTYLDHNPTWGGEDSPWKAREVARLLRAESVQPTSICEIGCGAGGVLDALRDVFPDAEYVGYDISPQAIDLARKAHGTRVRFELRDAVADGPVGAHDLALILDVVEHVEDIFDFMRRARDLATYKVFHIPLDLSVQSVFRRNRLVRAWDKVGHVHFFTKEIALRAVAASGHEIVAHRLTAGGAYLEVDSRLARAARWPRRLAFSAAPALTARTLGGCSLLLLTR